MRHEQLQEREERTGRSGWVCGVLTVVAADDAWFPTPAILALAV